MLLSIAIEKEAISSEMRILDKIRYKLANQLRHFKEYNQLKLITKMVDRHLRSLHYIEKADIKQISTLLMEPFIAESERIRSYLITKGHQLKRLINDAVFIPFATLALCCIAKLNFNVDKI